MARHKYPELGGGNLTGAAARVHHLRSYLVDRANLLLFRDLGNQRQRLLSLQARAVEGAVRCKAVQLPAYLCRLYTSQQ